MRSLVIIPTYNEKKNIAEIVPMVRQYVGANHLHVLVVDSASPDRTAEAVRDMQKNDPGLFLFQQPEKLGLGNAYLDGMRWALDRDYEAIMTMDADFSHHPRYLPLHLEKIKDADLVIGSRYTRGGKLENWPFYRQALSRFANWYARTLTGLPFNDLTSGFHCFRAELLRNILRYNIHTEGYAFLIELKFLAILQEARYAEFPIVFSDRTEGDSKISKRVMFESMSFVLKIASQRRRIRRSLKHRELLQNHV